MNEKKIKSSFVNQVQKFVPRYDYNDLIWKFYLKINRSWHSLYVQFYRDTYYLGGSQLEHCEISFKDKSNQDPRGRDCFQLELLEQYTKELTHVYKEVKKDPILYHKKLMQSVAPSLRKGVLHRRFVNMLIPEYLRYDLELSPKETKDMIEILKKLRDDEPLKKMTTGLYFKYCKIAYLANPQTFDNAVSKKMTGREMYKRWADGRDGGLSDIKANNAEAFNKWYHDGAASGGHPWEIYRGGNSTHINLGVSKHQYKEGYEVSLTAFSSTRLVETCRIALALKKAGLKFKVHHRESYLKRLLREDYVGILPEGSGIKYGWHEFPKEFNVSDCIYYSWFKDDYNKSLRPMSQIKQLITWFPIYPLVVVG